MLKNLINKHSNYMKSIMPNPQHGMDHSYRIDCNVFKPRSNYQTGLTKTAWKTIAGCTH